MRRHPRSPPRARGWLHSGPPRLATVTLAAGLALLLGHPAPASAQEADTIQEAPDAGERSLEIIELIRAQAYQRLEETYWSAEMVTRIPPRRIGEGWARLERAAGSVGEVGEPEVGVSEEGDTRVTVRVRFGAVPFVVALTYDDNLRVIGFDMEEPG